MWLVNNPRVKANEVVIREQGHDAVVVVLSRLCLFPPFIKLRSRSARRGFDFRSMFHFDRIMRASDTHRHTRASSLPVEPFHTDLHTHTLVDAVISYQTRVLVNPHVKSINSTLQFDHIAAHRRFINRFKFTFKIRPITEGHYFMH